MTRDYVECPEGAGKTIKSLKIYEHDTDGCETLIEFTDSTSFYSSVCHRPTFKGTLFEEEDARCTHFGVNRTRKGYEGYGLSRKNVTQAWLGTWKALPEDMMLVAHSVSSFLNWNVRI